MVIRLLRDLSIAQKDNDFLSLNTQFKLEPTKKDALYEVIAKDSQFLAENAIIDYSLMIGVHSKSKEFNRQFF